MKETHTFLVPDYYPGFKCKMGECRHACCEGWPVTVSLEDYYRLLNTECDDELRGRITASLRVLDRPTRDEYAEISHDYTGACRLRMEDGRCALHAGAGEDALAPVCRLYPRGVRGEGDYESSCACSCEKTLEMLYEHTGPITFVRHTMTVDMPGEGERSVFFETLGREQEIRMHFIRVMMNRRLPIYMRLVCLTDAISDMEAALGSKDEAEVDRLIASGCVGITDHPAPTFKGLRAGLAMAEKLISEVDEMSGSVREYGIRALEYFDHPDVTARYALARERFETICPNAETFFENMLVNHMFFMRFPFQDRPDSISREKTALDAVYTLLRFTALGCVEDLNGMNGIIDIFGAIFRMLDHSSFDSIAGGLLTKLGCDTREKQIELLEL